MKLNPSKCAFGVPSSKFLGYMVNQHGIKVNQEKIKALLNMRTSTKIKEVQQLTRRIAMLNRFVSYATNKHDPFFEVLTSKKRF